MSLQQMKDGSQRDGQDSRDDYPPTGMARELDRQAQPPSGHIASNTGLRNVAQTLSPSAHEGEQLISVVRAISGLSRHYELFLLLQGQVQRFMPHQILISAWGDFRRGRLGYDVVSAIPGVRTEAVGSGCIKSLMQSLYHRWTGNQRRPVLLDHAHAHAITNSGCNCALHMAMQTMNFVLFHGIRDEREENDSLYLALHSHPIAPDTGRDLHQFMDGLFAQIDIAFRKVAALPIEPPPDNSSSLPFQSNDGLLSGREAEIMKWICEGKTNVRIAEILDISAYTVKNHVQRIFRKLGANNRTEAVARYRSICEGS